MSLESDDDSDSEHYRPTVEGESSHTTNGSRRSRAPRVRVTSHMSLLSSDMDDDSVMTEEEYI